MNDNAPSIVPEYFYQVTPDRILRCVETSGVRCTGRVLQLNSLENRVYETEIELPKGVESQSRYDSFRVIKFYRPGRWTKAQIQDEHSFLLDLQAQEVPVVPPVTLEGGGTVGTEPESGIFYAVFPKAGGRLMDELVREQLLRLGRTVARLHNCGQSKEATNRLALTTENYGRESLRTLQSLKAIHPTIEERFLKTTQALCTICESKLSGIRVQRIHGDLHLGNIIWLGDQCSLVDFDDMLVGPVVQDMWLLFPGRDEYAVSDREIFLEGYEQIRSFDRRQLALTETLRTLRMLRFNGWIAARWQDPSFQRIFPTFQSLEYWHGQYITMEEQLRTLQGYEE